MDHSLRFSDAHIYEIYYNGQAIGMRFGPPECQLKITGGAVLFSPARVTLDAEEPPFPKELFELIGLTVASIEASDEGVLRLLLERDRFLEIASDGPYEAWEFYGPNGLIWIGGPENRVTVWGAEGPSGASKA